MNVIWVRFNDEHAQDKVFYLRKWWPVYDNIHSDPDLSEIAKRPHYHLAVNRISDATVRRTGMNREYLHKIAVLIEDVADIMVRAAPRVAANTAPHVDYLEQKLMGRVGPFEPVCGRCPHRGCPIEEFSADGRCPWHGIRVKV